jgi:tetratricopeptide (TPR) repeat protein
MSQFPPSAPENPAADTNSVGRGLFLQEGDYWTVGYDERMFRLKDGLGLSFISYLLRHPGTEFHVLDLGAGVPERELAREQAKPSSGSLSMNPEELEASGIHVGGLGDAGELLDEQAKAAYKARLGELREELEEAKEFGNVERAAKVEEEIDALGTELSRGIGLGGRHRRAASATERARQRAKKNIKAAIGRIARHDPELGRMFSRSIRTGIYCSYIPDPRVQVTWQFAGTTPTSLASPFELGGSAAGQGLGPAPVPFNADASEGGPSDSVTQVPVLLEVSPFSQAERTAFVGRESEGSAIRAVIDRALTGNGSIVMLWDGPGVGKSRLAMEMAEYASRNGYLCSVGRCYERDEPFPYLPFVEIIENNLARAASLDDYRRRMGDTLAELAQIAPSLRRIFADIPKPIELPPAQQRRYLFQSFSEALARVARTHPQLLVLEDLHWADESTLALLIYVADRIAQLPVVIVGTYRSGYFEENPALVRTLEELLRMGIRPQKLGGLSKDAIAQMLDGLSQRQAPESLVSLVFEESQGYPFFVEEVYRHLVEEGEVFDTAGEFRKDIKIDEIDVPANVRLIISRRLERLDENEKRALAAAAVIGRSFSFQLLTAISQIDVDELFTVIEKAQQMGLIVPSSEGPERPFTFRHELVRQTLLSGISAPRREHLHASVAEAIERLNPDAAKERTGEIIDHLLKAGSFVERRKLVRWLTLAGKRALDAAAFEEARRHFQSALSHQAAISAEERVGLLAGLAMAESGLARWDAAIVNLRESLEACIDIGDRDLIGKGFSDLTDALILAGRFQQAVETGRRGLSYLGGDVSVDRVLLLNGLSQALASAEGSDPAYEALEEALKLASQLSDPKLITRVVGVRSIINFHFFRLREAVDDGSQCEQMGGSEVPPWQRAVQLRALYPSLVYLGRTEEAARVANELEPFARKTGQSFPIALCRTINAWAEFGKAPDIAKLEADLREVSNTYQTAQFRFWVVISEAQLSLVHLYRGDWTGALSHAQASRRAEPGSSSEGVGIGMLFRQMAYAGDRTGALASLDENRTWMPRLGKKNPRGSWSMLALVIEGFAMLGEGPRAAELSPLARELINTGAVWLWPISRLTRTVAGIAAAAAHEWEPAEEHFQIAMRQAESFPYRLEEAEIRRFHAMMLMDRTAPGDREEAQTPLSEALEIYTHIGMPRHIEMTQALLARAAGR